jgi:hypothetical protein
MERSVVTILATNFSGSHFLSLMLGSHSQARHIGEIKHRRRDHTSPRLWCGICQDVEQCPVCRGVTPGTIDRVYETIFANFDDPNLMLLVDASKKFNWCERFLGYDTYEMKYVHLIRDPRALARRWMITDETDEDKRKARWKTARHLRSRFWRVLRGEPHMVYTYKWLYQNRDIVRFIAGHRLDHVTVTYHDLARTPETEVERLMRWLGLAYEPGQLEYWNTQHHGSQKQTYEWVKNQKTRYFDTRWKEFLTPEQCRQIAGDADVNAFLDELGLHLGADGLTRHAAARGPGGNGTS